MGEFRVLATCTLGLGFSYDGFRRGLEQAPNLIAADGGSADFGPYYLGSGVVQKSRMTLKRDLELLLAGAREVGAPFVTGSAGGAGARPHVEGTAEIVREVALEKKLSLRLATIDAEVDPAWLSQKVRRGQVRSFGGIPALTEEAVARLGPTVAMMGETPFMRALERGATAIVAGRATDPAIFAAAPLAAGGSPDVVWHAAKSIDKGYLATETPREGSPVLARIGDDHFDLQPTKPGSRCTVASVASLTLHENPDPYRVAQPTGVIDTQNAVYSQLDERTVRVTGSRYIPAETPSLKIEGAELQGYRTILIAGVRDPRILERMDEFLATYRDLLDRGARSMGIAADDYTVQFRVYGRDAVMGGIDTALGVTGHEAGLICDVVGRTEAISGAIGSRLGPTGSRLDILGNLGGGGVFAYPFSPSLIKVGPVYRWGAWHVVDVDREELETRFPITVEDL